jgi:hypothetical protein
LAGSVSEGNLGEVDVIDCRVMIYIIQMNGTAELLEIVMANQLSAATWSRSECWFSLAQYE